MILALTGFWLVVVSLIVFILIIGLIIVIHEFGHFLVARKAGILCYEFSIGMGPCIYKHQFKNTLFCLRAIPIGGYVSMADDDISLLINKGDRIGLLLDDDEVIKINADSNLTADIKGQVVEYKAASIEDNQTYITILTDDGNELTYTLKAKAIYSLNQKNNMVIPNYKETFSAKPLWKRFLTLFAGPFMNFVLAIIIYFIYYCAIGVPNYNSNVIGSVGTGYASSSYLYAGDVIVGISGYEDTINSWTDFEKLIDEYNKDYPESVTLKVLRNGQIIDVTVNYSIIINSIGISNLEIADYTLPSGVNGAIVGNIALNYVDENNIGTYPLESGDIITEIRVDRYINNTQTIKGEVIPITSWQDLIDNLAYVDAAQIRFTYYDTAKAAEGLDPYVYIDDCAPLNTWSNETLSSQNVEKIQFLIGISPTYHFELGGVISAAFTNFWSDFTLVFRTLKLLIAPSGIRQVGVSNLTSVVGIFDMVLQLVQTGILPILAFTAMLSVNIGIMNLLPIPALDGGRIIFLLYELITRRKPNKNFENILTIIFFVLLMLLFIFVTYNDIMRFNIISNGWRKL